MPKQTCRTIIFEEFDANKTENLYTMFDNLDAEPSDAELYRICKQLTVKNFDDFMKKFAPKVYEVYGRNNVTGEIEFFYTTDPTQFPNLPKTPVNIDTHSYYKMLARLYASKGASGTSNLQFDDTEIIEMLTPKKELDEVRDTRQKIEYNLKQFHEAKSRGDKATMNKHTQKIRECREKIAEYATSPVNKLLPILIEDTNKKLELIEKTTGGTSGDTKSLPAYTYGVLYLNGDGKIDIDENFKTNTPQIAAPAEENTALVAVKNNLPAEIKNIPQQSKSAVPDTQTIRKKIADTISKDYDENATRPSEMVKSLIISAFAPLTQNTEKPAEIIDKNALVERRQMFQNIYANARKSFIREMSKIVESLLGVKTFFDHATLEGGDFSEVPGGVIIANCKASRLLKIKEKFSACMKRLGKDETGDQRIWFAIVPNVLEHPPEDNSALFEDDDDDGMGGSLKDNEADAKKISADYVSINALKEFLPEMNAAKILTVFNIRSEKGTFSEINAAEVENKINLFEGCNWGHAVYAYPNFTLLNDREFYPFEGENDTKITLPGIFIDAAYPAAGLLIASQQQKILDKHKLKFDKETECVGIDLEDLQVKKAFSTKFNRESVLRRSENLVKAINQNMFGFSFSGDEVKDATGTWKNSYIHCARTLFKNPKTGIFKPIYQTLVEDYVTIELKLMPNKKPQEVIKKVNDLNKNYERKRAQYKEAVNYILREGENIEPPNEDNKGKVWIHFIGGEGEVDIDVEGTTD